MPNPPIVDLPFQIGKLNVPKNILGMNSWLGWNIVFQPDLTIEQIVVAIPIIEAALNTYLQENVDIRANHLIVPFSNKLTITGNRLIYNFKIRVFIENKFSMKELFMYPSKPVRGIDGYLIQKDLSVKSHINTVTLKPPPN